MSPNPLSTILHRTWWVLLLRGLVAIAFGVLTWAQPAVSLAALVLTFGAFTFVDGLLGVYSAIQGRDQMRHWWVLLLWGLAGVVVGVLTVVAPGVTALPGAGMMAMLWVLATYAVIFGVLMVLLSFKLKKGIRHSS
jgi:uncharacterized membrane protein HdeD (DUF308 family)